ncbi:hypothetical protein scyTo_0014304 [Scyliorhinus torazame]|uniref:Glia maturation factor n=1 Tax=Scyliorhinus torazame TaxID=75743 RepID=A0A401NK44_SCYTO|nr:hypothetical protein [Scyliorhinus torazame]
MSDSLVVCDLHPKLQERLKKFRFCKDTTNAAIIIKVNKENQEMVVEEEHEDISPDSLRDELPERQPRYPLTLCCSQKHLIYSESLTRRACCLEFIVYRYKYVHYDKRVSYPMCLIFSSPQGCNPLLQMMYAGSKNRLVQIGELTKVGTSQERASFITLFNIICFGWL